MQTDTKLSMKVYSTRTFANAYAQLLFDITQSPEYIVSPRSQTVHEIHNCVLEFNPLNALYTNDVRSSQFKYISAELLWYFSGRQDIEFIQRYSSFWKKLVNDDGVTVNSAYGHQLFTRKNEYGMTSWQWALQQLISDTDTRQAVMHINAPEHQQTGTKDFPCTLSLIFMIRDDMLHLDVHMRSNDVILGLPTDVAFFTILHQQMLRHLKTHDRFINTLELGTYTHYANSMHLYERHFELVERMLQCNFVDHTEAPVLDIDFINILGDPLSVTTTMYDTLNTDCIFDIDGIETAHESKFISSMIDSFIAQ